jgi:hypothetical protein
MEDVNLFDAVDDDRTLAEVRGSPARWATRSRSRRRAELEAGRADAARAILEGSS